MRRRSLPSVPVVTAAVRVLPARSFQRATRPPFWLMISAPGGSGFVYCFLNRDPIFRPSSGDTVLDRRSAQLLPPAVPPGLGINRIRQRPQPSLCFPRFCFQRVELLHVVRMFPVMPCRATSQEFSTQI